MINTLLNFGAFGFGLIFGGLVLLVLLLLSLLRKARLSKCWAAIGLIGVGASLSLTGVALATTSGIMILESIGSSSDPSRLDADLKLTDHLFFSYQTLGLTGFVLGSIVLILTAKPKVKV